MLIPQAVYYECEKWLRKHSDLIHAATLHLREVRAEAYSVRAAALDSIGGERGTGRGDALERKAMAVTEAEEQLRLALRWNDIVTRLKHMYPEETREGTAFDLLYQRGMTQEEVCRLLNVERKTVRRCRDKLVINCALLAVQEGLVQLETEDGTNGNL